MNINIISRGKGKSAVGAAAYRAGEQIKNEYDGQTHDYTKKTGIVYTEMFLPINAPDEYGERSILWNAVEKIEKNKNAQLSREVRLALPAEFTLEQNIKLVHEYIRDNFVYHGMCADICIHDKADGNPHAHVLLTMRPIERDGTWAAKSKMEYILDDNGERIKLPSGRYKTRKITATDWDECSKAEEWRKAWADIVNAYLENGGHKSRVDHRSYERQGVEQIPTIHLGVAAHDMEKRGIRTERGSINRNVRKANAMLKNIDNRIHEIKNPPMPQMIIDLEKSIKAQESPGYANWAKIFNLKQAAQTLIYIQDNGYSDVESLIMAQRNIKSDVVDIQKQINVNRLEIKNLTALKTQANNYRKTVEIYKKYTVPGQLPMFKKDFYARHKDDIEKHIKARNYIFDELKLDKFPSLKKLSGDISDLYEKEKALRQGLASAQQKMKALSNAEHNARMLLGYRELESQGYIPTIPQNDLRFIKPYESSFAEAQKVGETEAYFQSCTLDYECAEDIYRASSNVASHKIAAEEILMKYSKERAEHVVAAIVNHAPADKYPDHREWALQVGNAVKPEPSVRNIEIFQKNVAVNIFNSFIQTFRKVADSMIDALLPVVDDTGKRDWKAGWALPKEFVSPSPKAEEKSWDVGLSFKEKIAAAERQAKEYNRNNSVQSHKPKRNNNHDL